MTDHEWEQLTQEFLGKVLWQPQAVLELQVPIDAVHPRWQALYAEMQRRVVAGEPLGLNDMVLDLARWLRAQSTAGPSVVELSRLTDFGPAALPYFATQLQRAHHRRRVLTYCESLKTRETIALEAVMGELSALTEDGGQQALIPLEQAKREYVAGGGAIPCVALDHGALDATWHWTDGGLHIIAGRPGMGKTSLLVWCLQALLRREVPTLLVSLEMTRDELVGCMASSWVNGPGWIHDGGGLTVEHVVGLATLAQRAYGIRCVLIDYLQLLRTSARYDSREQQVAAITGTLKQLAKRLRCPVVVAAQLNRLVEQSSTKRPSLGHLRESGAVEQDADSVALLYRPEYYLRMEKKTVPPEQMGLCELSIAKQRRFPTGTVYAHWVPRSNNWTWGTSALEVQP